MPAHTHTQPAQPTTLGHYLQAVLEVILRDAKRLRAAYETVNVNPLGACAITTTGFPINRHRTAELLGFEGLQTNSYGAIAAIDYVAEACSASAVLLLNVGKVTQDFLLWCTAEFGFLRLPDAFVQCSSIMPQKRNPVALEHTRILASRAFAQCQSVLTTAHNTPFGDIVDSEDDLWPLVFHAFEDTQRAVKLFRSATSAAQFQTERMRAAAGRNFLTVTELADSLVREEAISFKEAHEIVSTAVKRASDDSADTIVAEAKRAGEAVLRRPLKMNDTALRKALDPEHFVALRKVDGGPAVEALDASSREHERGIATHREWLQAKQFHLEDSERKLAEAAMLLVR
jgi:argininosuccinate lyase